MSRRPSISVLFALTLAGSLPAQEQAIITIDENLDDAVEQIDVIIKFGFGKIKIERGNPSKAVTGFIQYYDEMIAPDISYRGNKSTAVFRLETKMSQEGWGFSRWRDFDEYDMPESELYFTTRVPLDIQFSCGLGEAELDLGDLLISDANIENGLGATLINFSSLNKVVMRRLSVDNGLGELRASNLSNANTTRYRFSSGLGDADLDFGGELLHDIQVDANIGLGSMTFRIPRIHNVELEAKDSFLSTIDTPGMVQVRRGLYRSRDYDSSKPTIFISANIGLGSIRIIWTD
ncbi:MAG: hypothetical protein IID15_00280 [Candidatus Marinimicrobia bacterium]|nr:hypothetical protein [Candidatus Neomarinimicrobiota bacterium]